MQISFKANFSFFSLAESPPPDLQITAYKNGLLMCNTIQLCLAAKNLLMHKGNRTFLLLVITLA